VAEGGGEGQKGLEREDTLFRAPKFPEYEHSSTNEIRGVQGL
jgi:hypothetical protein